MAIGFVLISTAPAKAPENVTPFTNQATTVKTTATTAASITSTLRPVLAKLSRITCKLLIFNNIRFQLVSQPAHSCSADYSML